ncbi:MAG: hypothetical protein V4459_14175 [Pseudomonadota bacterium]
MTRLLAEMQTTIFHSALPLFDGSVVRFGLFVLVQRQTMRGQTISVHALAQSLGLPFETCRRQIGFLIDEGRCCRTGDGLIATALSDGDAPIRALTELAHDCFVRFVEDFLPFLPTGDWEDATGSYDWQDGAQAAADMMLAVAVSNLGTHQDWTDLVIFSAVLCANFRLVTISPELSRRYAAVHPPVPASLLKPVRPAAIADALHMPISTVRRRLAQQRGRAIDSSPRGLVISMPWFNSDPAIRTSAASYANVRRLLASLLRKGFPFHDVATAYLKGRPAPTSFDWGGS